MNPDEFKTLRTASAYPEKRSKYGARKSGGYDSRKEHRRANQLKLMQRAGLISNLREQVPYEIIPAQYGKFGKDLNGESSLVLLERSCRYVADFVYTDNATGQTVVEDTKGFKTAAYIIKRKLMLYVYGIQIREV